MKEKWGVIVVDVQGDFTEWKNGSLAVPGTGQRYVESVENKTRLLKDKGLTIFGTQDWHPADHISFAANHKGKRPFDVIAVDSRTQVLWPVHCLHGTENARVLVDNNLFLAIVKKGQNAAFDSYSGFRDDGGSQTEMDTVLRRNGIGKLVIYGLATDYCVRATVLDALLSGYRITVMKDLCKGITPETTAEALDRMKQEGARIVDTLQGITDEIGS